MKNSTKYIIIGVSILALGASAFFILKKPKPKQIPTNNNNGQGGQGLVDDEPVRDNIENQLEEYSQTVDDETEYRSIADICREDFDNPICGN
jgi:hypothetical protein